jgi:2-hydroxychromene-2-carboxylate isomerase
MKELIFYYDFASPYGYLASTQVERIARAHGATPVFRPILLGALFKSIGTPMVPIQTFSEAKRRYFMRDVHHWAEHWGVPFHWPSRFPMRTLTALRMAIASKERLIEVSHAFYRAYWVEDRDLADPAVLKDVGGAELLEKANDPAVKQALVGLTDEAVQGGACGVPTFRVREHLFWGQDRFDLVEKALDGWDPPG